jgi:hypothetical protein
VALLSFFDSAQLLLHSIILRQAWQTILSAKQDSLHSLLTDIK